MANETRSVPVAPVDLPAKREFLLEVRAAIAAMTNVNQSELDALQMKLLDFERQKKQRESNAFFNAWRRANPQVTWPPLNSLSSGLAKKNELPPRTPRKPSRDVRKLFRRSDDSAANERRAEDAQDSSKARLGDDEIVMVLLVHNRPAYLRRTLAAMRRVEGIRDVLLIVRMSAGAHCKVSAGAHCKVSAAARCKVSAGAHCKVSAGAHCKVSAAGAHCKMDAMVRAIDFCPVKQIYFPFSPHLFNRTFPAASPDDCQGRLPRSSLSLVCPPLPSPLQHHWWWAMNAVWGGVAETRGYGGHVVWVEEDHMLFPNALRHLQVLLHAKHANCPHCIAANLAPSDVHEWQDKLAESDDVAIEDGTWLVSSRREPAGALNQELFRSGFAALNAASRGGSTIRAATEDHNRADLEMEKNLKSMRDEVEHMDLKTEENYDRAGARLLDLFNGRKEREAQSFFDMWRRMNPHEPWPPSSPLSRRLEEWNRQPARAPLTAGNAEKSGGGMGLLAKLRAQVRRSAKGKRASSSIAITGSSSDSNTNVTGTRGPWKKRLSDSDVVMVLLVHNRPAYLRRTLEALSKVEGIEDTLLIVSHDGYYPEMHALVRGITFCAVKQLYFPLSPHLFSASFPAASPADCRGRAQGASGVRGEGARGGECTGQADQYGSFRDPGRLSLKHHWWWAMNAVWGGVEETRGYGGHVVWVEEDHLLFPNALRHLQALLLAKHARCPHCIAANLAPSDVHSIQDDEPGELAAERMCNVGYAFNRSVWELIHAQAKPFCLYDDYNWDLTLWSSVLRRLPSSWSLRWSRASAHHVGSCGLHSGQGDSQGKSNTSAAAAVTGSGGGGSETDGKEGKEGKSVGCSTGEEGIEKVQLLDEDHWMMVNASAPIVEREEEKWWMIRAHGARPRGIATTSARRCGAAQLMCCSCPIFFLYHLPRILPSLCSLLPPPISPPLPPGPRFPTTCPLSLPVPRSVQSGAWCTSPWDCYNRSSSLWGSSKHFPDVLPTPGILSAQGDVNPDLYDWNLVIFPYCDGASFSGDRQDPLVFEGVPLFSRGRPILDFLLAHLTARFHMGTAQRVLISGCSAGALVVYLHCDYIRHAHMPPSASVQCLADSGLFLDIPDISGGRAAQTLFRSVLTIHNVTGSLPASCVSSRPPEDHYQCFMSAQLLPLLKTPTFIINSNYDLWLLRHALAPPEADPSGELIASCLRKLHTCNQSQLATLQGVRDTVTATVAPLLPPAAAGGGGEQLGVQQQHGVFLFSCLTHCTSHYEDHWLRLTVLNQTLMHAVGKWLRTVDATTDAQSTSSTHGGVDGFEAALIDCPYPCNSCNVRRGPEQGQAGVAQKQVEASQGQEGPRQGQAGVAQKQAVQGQAFQAQVNTGGAQGQVKTDAPQGQVGAQAGQVQVTEVVQRDGGVQVKTAQAGLVKPETGGVQTTV
ncbi:unnamed protein product [Closterium sp. Naga37s-1]|nr:unnamed protein product [Closterium sp. Naga37s-1]